MDLPKDESKVPGGLAGGKASAERPEEDRRESSRKAAATRAQNMVGPGMPAQAGQPQSYDAELRGGSWAVQREGDVGALRAQVAEGDRQAAEIEQYKDKQDPDYDPSKEA
ncbi:plasmid stabilization [Micractinium conductrix]|uniref:Plasmid stabilization n=1 Tax=Micractinium conductrix TaxID=554055 RepID=A0A2P6VNY6_9CHLO|nr:plasmid stabilization [Micractinium conductrix]|eukprot:PSC75813.1 plasmid stabilization [Micractinium conductrix]